MSAKQFLRAYRLFRGERKYKVRAKLDSVVTGEIVDRTVSDAILQLHSAQLIARQLFEELDMEALGVGVSVERITLAFQPLLAYADKTDGAVELVFRDIMSKIVKVQQ